MRKALVALLLLLLLLVGGLTTAPTFLVWLAGQRQPDGLPAPVSLTDKPTIRVELKPFRVFNGLSKKELYRLRSEAANAHAEVNQLFAQPGGYKPDEAIFDWSKDGSYGWLTYDDLESYFSADQMYHASPRFKPGRLTFHAYNSRDLGYRYFSVDQALSRNITWDDPDFKAVPIPQLIHCGGSCGCPGGCNNKSPKNSKFDVTVKSTPARIYIKLWKELPPRIDKNPERWFVIDIKG